SCVASTSTAVYTLSLHDALPILGVLDGMTAEALRVLAAAFRPLGPRLLPEEQWEQGLIFAGLVGMLDPPRPEVAAAVQAARLGRSEEHTSELQSRENLVCRLLLE